MRFSRSKGGFPIDFWRCAISCSVAITYRVHDFENFDENFVQGTISPVLKSHIPLDGSVSLSKYLPTELKRIGAKDSRETPTEQEDWRKIRPLSEKDSNFCQNGLNFVLALLSSAKRYKTL